MPLLLLFRKREVLKMKHINSRIQLKYDHSSYWSDLDPLLLAGEVGIESDTNKFKIGDGITHWSELPYSGSGMSEEEIMDIIDSKTENVSSLKIANSSSYNTTSDNEVPTTKAVYDIVYNMVVEVLNTDIGISFDVYYEWGDFAFTATYEPGMVWYDLVDTNTIDGLYIEDSVVWFRGYNLYLPNYEYVYGSDNIDSSLGYMVSQ